MAFFVKGFEIVYVDFLTLYLRFMFLFVIYFLKKKRFIWFYLWSFSLLFLFMSFKWLLNKWNGLIGNRKCGKHQCYVVEINPKNFVSISELLLWSAFLPQNQLLVCLIWSVITFPDQIGQQRSAKLSTCSSCFCHIFARTIFQDESCKCAWKLVTLSNFSLILLQNWTHLYSFFETMTRTFSPP